MSVGQLWATGCERRPTEGRDRGLDRHPSLMTRRVSQIADGKFVIRQKHVGSDYERIPDVAPRRADSPIHDTRNQVGSIAWRCLTNIPSDSMYLFSPILSKNSGRRVSISSCMCLTQSGTHLSISLRRAAGSNGLVMSNPNSPGSMADTTSGGSGTGEGNVLTPALGGRDGRRRRTYSQQASRGRAKRWCWSTLVVRPARKGSETCSRQKGKRSVSARMRRAWGQRRANRIRGKIVLAKHELPSCFSSFGAAADRVSRRPTTTAIDTTPRPAQQPQPLDEPQSQGSARAVVSRTRTPSAVVGRHPTHPQNDDAPRSEQTRNPQTRGNRPDHPSPPRTRRTGPSATAPGHCTPRLASPRPAPPLARLTA